MESHDLNSLHHREKKFISTQPLAHTNAHDILDARDAKQIEKVDLIHPRDMNRYVKLLRMLAMRVYIFFFFFFFKLRVFNSWAWCRSIHRRHRLNYKFMVYYIIF